MNREIITLKKNSVEVEELLLDGSIFRYGEHCIAIPREIVPHPLGNESIVFEVIRSRDLIQPSLWKMSTRAIRPRTLALTLSPGIAVFTYGILHRREIHLWVGILALLGALFLHLAIYFFNDVEDHLRLVDVPRLGSIFSGGSGVIQKGWINAKQMKQLALFVLFLGAALGVPSLVESPQMLFWIASIAVLGVLSYSNRPFGAKYRALGDFWVFGLSGPLLTLGISQAFFRTYDLGVGLIGIFFGLLSWTVYHSKNLTNLETDGGRGVRTLANMLGFERSRQVFLGLYVTSFLTLTLGVGLGVFSKIPVSLAALGVIPSFILVQRVYRASGPISPLLVSLPNEALKIHWAFGVLLSLGFLLNLVF